MSDPGNRAAAGDVSAPRRPLPNGRDHLVLIRGGKISKVQQEARELGLALQALWFIHERADDYLGGW